MIIQWRHNLTREWNVVAYEPSRYDEKNVIFYHVAAVDRKYIGVYFQSLSTGLGFKCIILL